MDLPPIDTSKEFQVIGRNDVHEESMVNDKDFMEQMKKMHQLNNTPLVDLTKAGDNAAQNAEVLVTNTNEDWINKKWRPLMGYMYMAVCISDFIIFPVAWSIIQALFAGNVTHPWQPLTLQGAGLFHISMGAVLGIAVYGRTQEKLNGKNDSLPITTSSSK